ncbi:MAG: extradiol ring-cleavage dioxygenase [Candidatus Bathyarchaeia archaeon]
MGIVYACVAPHGAEIIPKLAGRQLEAFGETRKGMGILARAMGKHGAGTIVIATPHSLRLDRTIGVVTTEYSEGSLKAHGKSVKARFRCDRQLAQKIVQEARHTRLPVVGVNFGTSEGPSSCMPMDWGTLIPLWFLGIPQKREGERRVVIVTPSREIPLVQLVSFGKAIAEAAETSSTKVAFVASADQGHAHDKEGPYGFSPASAKYDKLVIQAIKQNNLKRLLELDMKFVEDAKPDSLWQMAILTGIIEHVPMEARFVSYQAPTYYGMLCADFEPS